MVDLFGEVFVEEDLVWFCVSLDRMNTVFRRFGESLDKFRESCNGLAINGFYDLAIQAVVTDGCFGGDDASENDDTAAAFFVIFRIAEDVEKVEWGAVGPFFTKGLKVGT